MKFDPCLERRAGHMGPEMETHLKPKTVVFNYLRTESFTTPQGMCMRVS